LGRGRLIRDFSETGTAKVNKHSPPPPPPRTADHARIQELDRLLQHDPDALAARFERAGLLREQGLFEDAKRDYLELLRRAPTDFGALNDFGTLVLGAGYTDAARSLFGEAVRHHPNNPNGRVNLANLLFLSGEPEQARAHFEAALQVDPDHVHAHRGMGNLLAELGDAAGARRHRDKAFKDHVQTTLPYRGDGSPVFVLLLLSAAGGNIPTATILDDRQFRTTVLVADYADPRMPLPHHDLVFNSIGDADLCREALEAADCLLRRTDRPVINHPRAVLETGRASNAARLRGLPNVIVPRMVNVPRRLLAGAQAQAVVAESGFSLPFLVRAPGFHTGRHFVRVENLQELNAAVAQFPGDEVWLIDQLDARDGDGFFRKLRVMIIDGKIYPLHLAISRHWKIHYFKADMANSPENRRVDEAFLNDMPRFIGPRGMAALERVNAALDLDYGGIDFAVNADGDILVFEANATMVMVPLSDDQKWDYRRPAFDAVFGAIRAMLLDRAGSRTGRMIAEV
jgi:Tetratricopeptide repeat